MHIFGLRRAKSIASKNNSKHPDSAPSSATSSKLQLVSQPANGVQSTPSTSPVLPNDHASPSNLSAAHSSSPTKRVIGSKIRHRDVVDDRSKTVHSISPSPVETQAYQGLTPPPPRSPRAPKPTYSELYTQNDLSTFSFGAAPAAASSSSVSQLPVDPLTRLPEDDEISLTPSALQDTTPRPSVVGGHHPLTHNSQHSTQNDWGSPTRTNPPSRGARAAGKAKAQDSDTASSHTFGTSSASASVSSLSRIRGDNSRAASRTSGYSSTTPQTSANDLTSDEDDDMIGRHPIPPEPRPPGPPFRYTSPDQESSLFLSEEEFEGDGYGEEYEPDIEIESAVPDDSDRETIDYMNASQESFVPIETERRGSAAMAVPKKQSDNTYHDSFPDNNSTWDYDYSKNRRGSKSMIERSFMQSGESSSHERPLPPAPSSVPESEGDWQNLRKKSMTAQRDKDLSPAIATNSSSMASSSTHFSSNNSSTAADSAGSDTATWIQNFSVNGVVSFDSSEMQDIVGTDTDLGSRFFRKGSTNSAARRTSTVSSTDIIHKNITTSWANANDRERRLKWSSVKVKEGADEQTTRRHNGGERDRPSIANLFPRASTSTSTDFRANGSNLVLDKSDSKHKDKDKTAASKPKWTGMAPDAEEIWFNSHLGKHKVQRKNAPATEPGKPQQQRLQAQHLRSPTGGRDQPDGPSITIHKHSKAAAFSLSRSHRRTTSSSNGGQATNSGSSRHVTSSGGQVSSRDSTSNNRKKSNMILLATRRVQKAYTSTNTTRKLDTHGLLDDGGRTSPQPQHQQAESSRRANEREHDRHRSSRTKDKEPRTRDKESRTRDKESRTRDKESRTRDKEPRTRDKESRTRDKESRTKDKELRAKDKERKGKEREKDKSRSGEASSRRPGTKSEGKLREVVAAETPLPDSSESSAGSVSYAISSGDSGTMVDSSSGTSPDQTQVTDSIGSTGSIEPSIRSQETASSDRTISRSVYKGHAKPRRRGDYESHDDVGEDDEEDSSDGIPGITRPPTRTPHRETYAALPPEVFENAHQEQSSSSLFSWGRSKGNDRNGHRANQYLEGSYKPPWPVTQPRTNSETRKGIVDDLNTSFQDVGLLPATGEIKSSNHNGQRRKRDQHPKKSSKRSADSENQDQADIFESVPDEALYMLLPLYPSDTDPYSSRKYPYTLPTIPTHARQYLMIYYKTYAPPHPTPEETSKSRSGEKKRSQEAAETSNDKSVLLHTFHITARVFSYRDLQGTGVRIPELGLAVCGPLEEAFDSIPLCQRKDQYVIGVCHSREAGIEFVPEGFEKMGLTKAGPNTPEPSGEEEDSGPIDPLRDILTPIGRAVMEMAWIGALAVSSFNPNHS